MKKLDCILLIDDNPHTNYFNKKLIQKYEFASRVYSVENGREGIDFLTKQGRFGKPDEQCPTPDLILLDINMPVMDGWDFLKEYEKLTKAQKAKMLIIMLTTSPNADDAEKANAISDVIGFERKPLHGEKFRQVIEKYFSEKASQE